MDVTQYKSELDKIMSSIKEANVHYSDDSATNRLTMATIYATLLMDSNVEKFSKKTSKLSWIMIVLTAAMLIAVGAQIYIAVH